MAQALAKNKGKPRDSVYEAIEAVGDAWSWLVMREVLFYDVRRFNEFQRNLGIARATLTSRLEQLMQGGLLRRKAGRNTVEYEPTPRGLDFFVPLAVALRWGEDWCSDAGAPSLEVTHQPCGEAFRAVLQCEACRAPIDARDVDVQSVSRASSELIASTRQRTPNLRLLERVEPCALARALMVMGDRWSTLVVRECFLGTRRFDAFSARLGIAPNILSSRLHDLIDHGVLDKRPYQDRPPRHEYRLTKKGIALYPLPLSMLAWGDRWLMRGRGGMRLTHRPCGKPLKPVLGCATCSQPATVTDVTFRRASV